MITHIHCTYHFFSFCSSPISSPPLSRRTQDDSSTVMKRSPSGSLGSNPYLSNSNPDLTSISSNSLSVYEPEYNYSSHGSGPGDCPEHVLKIYRADQSCKYFLVHKVIAFAFPKILDHRIQRSQSIKMENKIYGKNKQTKKHFFAFCIKEFKK